ncbi:dehydration-responsive element binding protein 3 [Dorcoceras hygrometricum]|uniref:Dehydration-responsive element binding protein 3 n=1 Tax=Dorcoceras hygrometricum TaxID=472368 RepID=A0A2Z7AA58_9LAMI|nr:dehydration-responsive element binding protein 3 [Dorcoceras hygrometricum]
MVRSTSSTVGRESEASAASSSCKYKGVRKRKWGKFVSEIRLPNSRERIWLGSYDTAEKAARAFDAALFCLRGRNAKFNFPENPPEISNGMSMSPESPCPSVSYGTAQADNVFANMPLDTPFLDQFLAMGHENNAHDIGVFTGYEDFSGEFYIPPLPSSDLWPDYTEEEISSQNSFLWNF